jgi:hypothetical protein
MRMTVRPLIRSDAKHFSTIQLEVWTSRLSKRGVKNDEDAGQVRLREVRQRRRRERGPHELKQSSMSTVLALL